MGAPDDMRIGDDDLRHEAVFAVLGVPVRIRTDSPEILAAAQRAFGYWRVLDGRPELLAGGRVEGRLVIGAGDEGGPRPRVLHRLSDRRRLLVSTPASVCAADADRREFCGWVTRELVASRDHFRYHVLEALVMSVVTWLDRIPVHASAVVRDGAALLLTGPSGRGKSTLTWAAAEAGLRVLADDMVFVQTQPLRVWGMPTFLHLPEESRRFFPGLADAAVGLASSGKEKIALDLHGRGVAAPFPRRRPAGDLLSRARGRSGPPGASGRAGPGRVHGRAGPGLRPVCGCLSGPRRAAGRVRRVAAAQGLGPGRRGPRAARAAGPRHCPRLTPCP